MKGAWPAAALLLPLALAGCSQPQEPAGGVFGTAMVGPSCPVETDPPDPDCADRPYEGRLVLAEAGGGDVVQRFQTGANGTFRVAAAPGSYDIRSPSDQTLPSCSTREPVIVREGEYTWADVSCDSGIR